MGVRLTSALKKHNPGWGAMADRKEEQNTWLNLRCGANLPRLPQCEWVGTQNRKTTLLLCLLCTEITLVLLCDTKKLQLSTKGIPFHLNVDDALYQSVTALDELFDTHIQNDIPCITCGLTREKHRALALSVLNLRNRCFHFTVSKLFLP